MNYFQFIKLLRKEGYAGILLGMVENFKCMECRNKRKFLFTQSAPLKIFLSTMDIQNSHKKENIVNF